MTESLRPQWTKSLRQFRTGVRVLHRLGALDQVCVEVSGMRGFTGTWNMILPMWRDPYWVTLLSTCIYEGRYPQELLRAFALTAPVTLESGLKSPTSAGIVATAVRVLRSHRLLLKESFYNIHYDRVKFDKSEIKN